MRSMRMQASLMLDSKLLLIVAHHSLIKLVCGGAKCTGRQGRPLCPRWQHDGRAISRGQDGQQANGNRRDRSNGGRLCRNRSQAGEHADAHTRALFLCCSPTTLLRVCVCVCVPAMPLLTICGTFARTTIARLSGVSPDAHNALAPTTTRFIRRRRLPFPRVWRTLTLLIRTTLSWSQRTSARSWRTNASSRSSSRWRRRT